MPRSRHSEYNLALKDRLLLSARDLRKAAESMAPGKDRYLLLRKARQNEVAAHIDDWLSSPGLRRPQ